MAWLEYHQELRDHPKFKELSRIMEWDYATSIGHVSLLWLWSLQHALNGDLRRYNDNQIAEAAGVAATDAKRFIEAMVSCGTKINSQGNRVASGLIDREPYFRVHDWWDRVGKYLKTKYKDRPELWEKVREEYTRGEHESNGGVTRATRQDSTEPDKTKQNQTTLPCPYQGIVDLYHSLLPGLPRVKDMTAARKGYLKARWTEKSERQSLTWWESFFKTYVLPSDFLHGRIIPRDGGKSFKADLEWIMRPNNFAKVYEGRYLSDNPPQPQKRPITPPSNAFDAEKEKAANEHYKRSEAWHKEFYKTGACPACGYKIKNDLDICDCETYNAALGKALESFKTGGE